MQPYKTSVYSSNTKRCVAETACIFNLSFQGNVPLTIKRCKDANRQPTETVAKRCGNDSYGTKTLQTLCRDGNNYNVE